MSEELTGTTTLITGATSGIGLATARALAQRGGTVVMVGHRPEKDPETVAAVQRAAPHAVVDYLHADLALQADVRRLARDVAARYPRLDVLINNVGGFFLSRTLTPDGIEMTFALNHLNVFLLTLLLLDTLKAGAPARIINVASDAHRAGRLDFDNLQGERRYNGWRAYANSKVAMIAFTYELARRLGPPEHSGIAANAMHPGFVATNLYGRFGFLSKVIAPLLKLFARSPEKGAETIIYLATAREGAITTGQYFVDERATPSSPATYDETAARRLWDLSLALTDLEEPSI